MVLLTAPKTSEGSHSLGDLTVYLATVLASSLASRRLSWPHKWFSCRPSGTKRMVRYPATFDPWPGTRTSSPLRWFCAYNTLVAPARRSVKALIAKKLACSSTAAKVDVRDGGASTDEGTIGEVIRYRGHGTEGSDARQLIVVLRRASSA